MQGKCRHCKTSKASMQAWKLCHTCYRLHRELYKPAYMPKTHRGAGNHNASRLPLGEPTDAIPGTPEKTAVVAARAEAGVQLWHPDDARDEDLSPGWGEVHLADFPALMSSRPACRLHGPRPTEPRFSLDELDHEP